MPMSSDETVKSPQSPVLVESNTKRLTSPKDMFLQPGQAPGSMTYVPPSSSYGGSLPIPALGQQGLPSNAPAGPYTALLGPQMQVQSLLQPGLMPGQYHPGYSPQAPGSESEAQQQSPEHQPKKRQSKLQSIELQLGIHVYRGDAWQTTEKA